MSTSVEFLRDWNKSSVCKGAGVVIDGKLCSTRIHSIFLRSTQDKLSQEDQLPTRFLALNIEVDTACRRNFDDRGNELPPKNRAAQVKSKGHLNHYDKFDWTLVSQVAPDELVNVLGSGGKPVPEDFIAAPLYEKLHPSVPHHFEFWADMQRYSHLDLKPGDVLRIRTLGDSIIVDSLVKKDAVGIPLFSSDPRLGNQWTQKIMAQQETPQSAANADDDNDDEWD